FGDALILDGARIERTGDGAAAVSLYWQSAQAIDRPLSYSVQALAGGRLIAQRDGPVGGEFADALAAAGGRQSRTVELEIPAGDAVEIAVAVYSPESGQRLATAGDYDFSPNLKRIGTLPGE